MSSRDAFPSFDRRGFLRASAGTLGAAALQSLLHADTPPGAGPALGAPHFKPRAKRVIWLFQSGGPSHMDLWDHKPDLRAKHGMELPPSIRGDQRITGMTSGQSSFPVVAPMYDFQRHGECGRWVSELLPYTAQVVDKLAVIKSVNTEAINHDPAVTFIQTGMQRLGRPSVGSWISYGLGSENRDFPSYMVLISHGSGRPVGQQQPLFARLWSSGFLPSEHQGVKLYGGREPVLYLNDPPGVDRAGRRRMLDRLAELNRGRREVTGDPEIDARIAQYEMAYRMQSSVPDLVELSDEPDEVFELYGPDARKPGTFAANCILARRLVERDVRFVQLFHRGWDQHENIPTTINGQCRDTDQPSAALLLDLERRGLLDDTLVIWGGEFGRTAYCQGRLTDDNYGRDHHGRCFTMWLAGGGIRPGVEYGATDDFCYNVVENPVHVRDLLATVLHCLGIDHERFSFKFQGLHQRLTGVEEAHVVRPLLA
ncbi:MAG: DUF1501 domain-containing protein [Planctomycetota bacterium]